VFQVYHYAKYPEFARGRDGLRAAVKIRRARRKFVPRFSVSRRMHTGSMFQQY